MRGPRLLYRFLSNLIDTPAVVLIYHRVTNLPLDPQLLSVSPENFDNQIKFLKEKYLVMDIEEFSEIISNTKKVPKNTVVITFDDGYADNLYEALPILEAHHAQALFYISTSLLDTKLEFWWDDLERVFLTGHTIPNQLALDINNISYTFNTSNSDEKKETYNALHPLVKNCKTIDRDNAVKRIVNWSGLSREGRESHRMLTTQELIKLSKSKSSVIGAHTHTHPKLSLGSFQEQMDDIALSKRNLEKILNNKIEHFSYPFGSKEDYNAESVLVCKKLGFKMVCANYHNQVHRWHSKFELPRMLVRNWSLKEFKDKMNVFFKF